MKAEYEIKTLPYYYIVKVKCIDGDYDKEIPKEHLEDFNDWLDSLPSYCLLNSTETEEYTNDDCTFSALVTFKITRKNMML